MYQQKYGKRFSTPSSGKNKASTNIVISSGPIEKVPEPVKPKSPERPPIRMSDSSAHPRLNKENYERLRYGRYFSRFSQKSPTSKPLNFVPTATRSSTGSVSTDFNPSEYVTRKELRECLQEALQEWRKMIPEFAEEIAKHIKNSQESVDSVCLLPKQKSGDLPFSGEFVPFFNDPENKTIDSKTLLDENGYMHLRVGLAGCLFSEEVLIYPFGSEKISLIAGNNELKMQFESTEGKIGALWGTLFQNGEGIYVIRVESCQIENEDKEFTELVDFSVLDIPLQVTFEGGLI